MKREAIIFDVDGTLVDVTSVRHHVLKKRKNYHAFHYGSLFCPPIMSTVDELHRWRAEGFAIIIVTARQREWETLTTNWLDAHGIPYEEIHMRATGDLRRDKIIKAEIYEAIAERFDVKHCYDDNPAIIELWNELGIPCTVIPGWAEEC